MPRQRGSIIQDLRHGSAHAEKMGGMRRLSRANHPTRAESEWCWDNSVTPLTRHGQLSIDGTKFVDERGAITQLKGVSTQWLNWEQS